MNYEYFNYDVQPQISATNVAYRVNPHLAERLIRAKAQKHLIQSVARSVRSGLRSIRAVLSDATLLQRKHGTQMYHSI